MFEILQYNLDSSTVPFIDNALVGDRILPIARNKITAAVVRTFVDSFQPHSLYGKFKKTFSHLHHTIAKSFHFWAKIKNKSAHSRQLELNTRPTIMRVKM